MALQPNVTRFALSLLIALVCTGTARVSDASTGAPGSQSPSASATVGFRIVIREVLRLDDQVQRLHASAPQTTRTVTSQASRRMVTVARP